MKRINITKLGENEEDRSTKIIEYITNHQGCNIQEVIRGVENYVSRVTVFNILDSLEKVGAIRRQKDKPNSRDHKLFVDTNNPLISLPKEFDEFKKTYYSLLETVKKNIKEYLSYPQRDRFNTSMCFKELGDLGLIFGEFIRIYNARALLAWPNQIRDPESLKNLYMLFFSKVLEILDEIDKVFQFLFLDLGDLEKEGIFASVGMCLLGPGFSTIFGNAGAGTIEHNLSAMLGLYNIHEHNDFEADTNRVLEHISTILKKDYDSYTLKVESLITKMNQQTGNFGSQERKRKQKILEF